MIAVSEVYKLIVADTTLMSLTEERVYTGNYPLGDGDENHRPISPYVILDELSVTPANLISGGANTDRTVIQIDIISEDYPMLKTIRTEVRRVLERRGVELESGSRWEDEVRMYRETMEWSFWFPR